MTSLPAIELSYGTDMATNWDVDRISFGDGYTQRSNPGINSTQQVWRLIWDGVSDAEAATLRAFFAGLKGTGVIDWTPFGQSTALKWTASKYSERPTGFAINAVSVVLTQEFDL